MHARTSRPQCVSVALAHSDHQAAHPPPSTQAGSRPPTTFHNIRPAAPACCAPSCGTRAVLCEM
eukprot:14371162-Alexandrium_andersonii.AAC.1